MSLLNASKRASEKVPYTLEDDTKIITLTNGGESASKVAKKVGRSVHSVRYRLGRLRQFQADFAEAHKGKEATMKDLAAFHAAKKTEEAKK